MNRLDYLSKKWLISSDFLLDAKATIQHAYWRGMLNTSNFYWVLHDMQLQNPPVHIWSWTSLPKLWQLFDTIILLFENGKLHIIQLIGLNYMIFYLSTYYFKVTIFNCGNLPNARTVVWTKNRFFQTSEILKFWKTRNQKLWKIEK